MIKGKKVYICSPLSAKTKEERLFNRGLRRRTWIRSAGISLPHVCLSCLSVSDAG